MAIIPEITCRRCGCKYSGLRNRCPKCGAPRMNQHNRVPPTTAAATPETAAYERGALKRAEKTGITVRQVHLPSDCSQEALMND